MSVFSLSQSEEDRWHFSPTNIMEIKACDSARFLTFKEDIENPDSFK